MAVYQCFSCGGGIWSGKEHEHKCPPVPFNVLANKEKEKNQNEYSQIVGMTK